MLATFQLKVVFGLFVSYLNHKKIERINFIIVHFLCVGTKLGLFPLGKNTVSGI
jgi:hypothetical protein